MANITFSEGSGVNKSIYGDSQQPIKRLLNKRGEEFEAISVIDKLFCMETSTNFMDKYTTMTAMDGFQPVGENGAYPTDGMEEGYSQVIEYMTWKDSFSISREIIEDAKAADLRSKPAKFITAYYRTRERFGAAMFGAAIKGNSSMTFAGKSFNTKCADGQNLFYSAHAPKVTGSNQCNLFSDAFSGDALGMLETKMQNFKGDNDELLDVAPDTIVIPNIHSLKKAVFAAIGAEKEAETGNNAFNYQFGRWNVIVWNYLNQFITSGTAPWMLMDSKFNTDYRGAVWGDRSKLEVRSTIDENTDANVWRGRARFNAVFNDWRFCACAGVSGATALD